jgi:hypothetical protein
MNHEVASTSQVQTHDGRQHVPGRGFRCRLAAVRIINPGSVPQVVPAAFDKEEAVRVGRTVVAA